jgi:hypothetical protein
MLNERFGVKEEVIVGIVNKQKKEETKKSDEVKENSERREDRKYTDN